MTLPTRISSRDNPLLAMLRKLARDGAAYRKLGQVWIEGDHLCRAALMRNQPVAHALICESGWEDATLRRLAEAAPRIALLPDALFETVSALDSPARIGFVLALPAKPMLLPGVASAVLDRVQDAGNVGSILRSAAALGASQVLALKGTVALWSPKVLRAGMGAHFALRLIEGLGLADLDALGLPLLATSSHAPDTLAATVLPWPCAWVLGHEGQGIDAGLAERCALSLRIPQPGGEESLNVASAAAICLYESARQRAAKESLSRSTGPA